MAVHPKKDKPEDRDQNKTQMELAKEERQRFENKQRAVEATKQRAITLFKDANTLLIMRCPVPVLPPDFFKLKHGVELNNEELKQARLYRNWSFDVRAVIALAVETHNSTSFAKKFKWNSDWAQTGEFRIALERKTQ